MRLMKMKKKNEQKKHNAGEKAYNEALLVVHKLIRKGAYKNAVNRMMETDGLRLYKPYRYDGNHSWYVIGDVFYKSGDYEMAIKTFRRAYEYRRDDAEALMALGNSYSELGRPKMAERCFRKAILINPDKIAFRFNLANALFDQGKLNQALKEYVTIAKANKGKISSKAKKMVAVLGQRLDDR